MKSIRLDWIIHIFALLHAGVALGCRFAGVDDELLLTVLTMALALIICMKKNLSIEFTAAIVIVMNILGYLLGTFGADLLNEFIRSSYAVNALSTTITTEILGWSVVGMTRFVYRQGKSSKGQDSLSSPYLKWFLLVAAGIFFLRLMIVAFFARGTAGDERVFAMTRQVLSNSFALSILICVNILYIRFIAADNRVRGKWKSVAIFILFMLSATLLESFLVGGVRDMIRFFVVAFITQITLYCLVYMINYAITARN